MAGEVIARTSDSGQEGMTALQEATPVPPSSSSVNDPQPSDSAQPSLQQDVFSYLMRMGERYNLRRNLQAEKKKLEESKELTHHPCISAVAQQLSLGDGTRYTKPITDRLHALHARQLVAREERRAAEQRKREAAERLELTFHPKVTSAAHAKKNRRDFPRIMDKWNEDRQRHLEDAQRKRCKEELREATGVPQISFFAAHYGHADRPPGMSIEDYLLQKGEEREERQYRRVENSRSSVPFTPDGSFAVLSRSSRSRSRSRSKSGHIQGISHHASERLRQSSFPAPNHHAGGGRHSAARTRNTERRSPSPPPPPSFHPTVTSTSTKLAQRYYAKEAHHGHGEAPYPVVNTGDVFDRLYYSSESHSRSRSPSVHPSRGVDAQPRERSGSIRRGMSTVSSTDASGRGHSFTPSLCPASVAMTKVRRGKSKERAAGSGSASVSNRSESPGTRLHAEAIRRQEKLAEMRRSLLHDSQYSTSRHQIGSSEVLSRDAARADFKPQVTAKSKELWERQVRALAADGTAANSQEAREYLWRSAEAYKREQLERAKALADLDEMRECTFHPETSARTKRRVMSPHRQETEIDSATTEIKTEGGKRDPVLSVALRNERWAQRREQRMEEQRRQRQAEEAELCPFQPPPSGGVTKGFRRSATTTREHSDSPPARVDGGSSARKKRESTTRGSMPRESEINAVESFVHRQELARTRREDVLQAVTLRATTPRDESIPVKASAFSPLSSSRNATAASRGPRCSSASYQQTGTVHVDPFAALKLSPEDKAEEGKSTETGSASASSTAADRRVADSDEQEMGQASYAVHRPLVFWPSCRGNSSVRTSAERVAAPSRAALSVSPMTSRSRGFVSASRSQSSSSPREKGAVPLSDYDWRASVQ